MSLPVKRMACLAAALALVSAGGAFASDIYKWTDAEGNVHYGDRAPENVEAERVDIQSRTTNRAQVAARVQARREARERLIGEQDAQESGNELSPDEQERLAEERARKCQMYKDRLQTFVQSRRLYRQDENGERVYLSEQEMQAARENVQNQVQEFCDS